MNVALVSGVRAGGPESSTARGAAAADADAPNATVAATTKAPSHARRTLIAATIGRIS